MARHEERQSLKPKSKLTRGKKDQDEVINRKSLKPYVHQSSIGHSPQTDLKFAQWIHSICKYIKEVNEKLERFQQPKYATEYTQIQQTNKSQRVCKNSCQYIYIDPLFTT